MNTKAIEANVRTVLETATVQAAIAASRFRGRNDKNGADNAAVTAMRSTFNEYLDLPAKIVIGEGERDEAPMLFIGEKVGQWKGIKGGEEQVQIAVDPLENTNACASGREGAVCVAAAALTSIGRLMGGPDCYFDKLCIGKKLAEKLRAYRKERPAHGFIDPDADLLSQDIGKVVRFFAEQLHRPVSTISVEVLDRERNMGYINKLRSIGAEVRLISDGDILSSLAANHDKHELDIALGIGAAPEGVISAAITRVFGGHFEATPWLTSENPALRDDHFDKFEKAQIDLGKVYKAEDLASGEVMFSITAVTGSQYMEGIRSVSEGLQLCSHSIFGRTSTGSTYDAYGVHPRPEGYA